MGIAEFAQIMAERWGGIGKTTKKGIGWQRS